MFNNKAKPHTARIQGYTLIELMTAVALISIIVGFSAPIYSNFLSNQSRSTALSAFHHFAITARSEAITRLNYVSICPSIDKKFCVQGSSDYSYGWIMFVNSDKDYPVVRDNNETLLQSFSLDARNYSLVANRNAFTFRPRHKRNTNGTLTVCPENISDKYQSLIISYTGRPRIDKNPKSSHIAICD